LKFTGLV